MGFKYEMNWYLVVNNLDDIKISIEDQNYMVIKDGRGIYPIGIPIPLIYKDDEKCVGLIKIDAIKLTNKFTEIYFNIVESYDKFYPMAKYYYNMYRLMIK